jgi:TPR repeat protein
VLAELGASQMVKGFCAVVLVAAMLVSVAAADFDSADAAYERGDYKTAFVEFKALADQGNADAQYMLGNMYVLGNGVPQDSSEAKMWYQRADEQGHPSAWLVLHRYDKQSKEPDASTDFIRWRLRQLEKKSNDPNASFLSNGWNSFIAGFCKVEFVCYAGDPNWLGWIVLGFGLIVIAHIMSLFNS